METPTYLVRSHFPAFTEASACATLRLSAQMSAMPCSAAATVLAVGAFTTRQPCCAGCKIFSDGCSVLWNKYRLQHARVQVMRIRALMARHAKRNAPLACRSAIF